MSIHLNFKVYDTYEYIFNLLDYKGNLYFPKYNKVKVVMKLLRLRGWPLQNYSNFLFCHFSEVFPDCYYAIINYQINYDET